MNSMAENTLAPVKAHLPEEDRVSPNLSAAERRARREELRVLKHHEGSRIPTQHDTHEVIATIELEGENWTEPNTQATTCENSTVATPTDGPLDALETQGRRDSLGVVGSLPSTEGRLREGEVGHDGVSERHATRSSVASRRSVASSRSHDPKRIKREESRMKTVQQVQEFLKHKMETAEQPEFIPTVVTRDERSPGDFRARRLGAQSNLTPSRSPSVFSPHTNLPSTEQGDTVAYLAPVIQLGNSSASSPMAKDPLCGVGRINAEDSNGEEAIPQREEPNEKTPLILTEQSLFNGPGRVEKNPGPFPVQPISLRNDKEEQGSERRPLHCLWGCCSCGCCGSDPDCCCYSPCSPCCQKERAPCVIQ